MIQRQEHRGWHLWAKSADEGPGHSLLGHLLDVGLTAEALLSGRPRPEVALLAEELELSEADAVRLIVVLVALHDIGKATPVFQAKWQAGAPPEAQRVTASDLPHGRASGIILHGLLCAAGFSRRTAASLANAVAIHHGDRLPADFMQEGTYDPRSIGHGSEVWTRWQRSHFEDVIAVLGPLPVPDYRRYIRGNAWVLLSGLTSIADWIGSSLEHGPPIEDPIAYADARKHIVSERLEEIQWPGSSGWLRVPSDSHKFSSWFSYFSEEFRVRPLQENLAAGLGQVAKPCLVIIEAPMGEGKTEAAFYAISQTAGESGAFLALPTQATSDAMFGRIEAFIGHNQLRPVNMALAHSTARYSLPLSESKPQIDSEANENTAEAHSWFTTGRRELLAEVGVGTVDQALMGIIPVRHFFVRLWGLAGKTIVLDEVHAYDTYTGGLVAELVCWLASVDCTVVLMSATLPRATTDRLISAWFAGRGQPDDQNLREPDSYPRLLFVHADKVTQRSFPARQHRQVCIRSAPYAIEALAEHLAGLAAAGAAVAAIVNTVDRAQELFRTCLGLGLRPTLLHARMPLAARKERERKLVQDYGPHAAEERRGGLVIGTQVIEQSLDLDFDVMVSDLAPIDLIFQRLGRMHRHARGHRPAPFDRPQLYVAGIGDEETGPLDAAIDTVYEELIMWRSWALLVKRDKLDLPEDLNNLVQLTYSEQVLPELEQFAERVSQARLQWRQKQEADAQAARAWSLAGPWAPSWESWGEAGVEMERPGRGRLRIPTRLGDESIQVVPVYRVGNEVRLPDSYTLTATHVHRQRNEFAECAVRHQIRISRKSLVAKLADLAVPEWWRLSPHLRHLVPLWLHPDGSAEIDPLVRLDHELGLVYERKR